MNKILLVDDAPDIQLVAQMALEKLGGFTVQVCGSGAEAVQRAQQFFPDLILLDVMMPGMDGPATLRALRELPPFVETPVVFMTARVQPREVSEYIALGAVNVISKPFDPLTLAETLRGIWTRSLAS